MFLLPSRGTAGNAIANGVMAIAVVLTVLSGLDYAVQAYRLRARSVAAREEPARNDVAREGGDPPEVVGSSPAGPDTERIGAVEDAGDGGRDGEPRGTVPA